MESLVLTKLSFKEKLALCLCILLLAIILSSIVYDFMLGDITIRDSFMSVGVFLLMLSAALTPKMFFAPLNAIWKGAEFSSIVNPKLNQWLCGTGLFICAFGLVWRLV